MSGPAHFSDYRAPMGIAQAAACAWRAIGWADKKILEELNKQGQGPQVTSDHLAQWSGHPDWVAAQDQRNVGAHSRLQGRLLRLAGPALSRLTADGKEASEAKDRIAANKAVLHAAVSMNRNPLKLTAAAESASPEELRVFVVEAFSELIRRSASLGLRNRLDDLADDMPEFRVFYHPDGT